MNLYNIKVSASLPTIVAALLSSNQLGRNDL